MNRRRFLGVSALAFGPRLRASESLDIRSIDRGRIQKAAEAYLTEAPIAITATQSPRSSGGEHDYFSEGDYWWPIQRIPVDPTSGATA
jgi:hypothetical protein